MRVLAFRELSRRTVPSLGAALLAGAVACTDKSATVSDDLNRDLTAARAASVELAPRGATGTQVISAVERVPRTAPATVRRQPTARPRATPAARKSPTRTPATDAPRTEVATEPPERDTSAAEAGTPAPRPRPLPTPSERRGPYKSVGDVIRDAPFPINP